MASLEAAGAATPAPWWLVLANGIASGAAALVLLTQPGADNLLALLVLLGAFWAFGGALELVDLALDRRRWAWKALGGLAGLAAGWAVLRHPLWSTLLVPLMLAQTLGIFALGVAIVQLLRTVCGAGQGMGVLGTQSLILGVVLLFGAPEILVWAGAAVLTVGGAAAIVTAFRIRLAGVLLVERRAREFGG
jgi:uncharacterized membrane protein HdeD (DUF308 family)